jgi:hypothetical protein
LAARRRPRSRALSQGPSAAIVERIGRLNDTRLHKSRGDLPQAEFERHRAAIER